MLSKSKVEKIASQSILVADLSDDELADFVSLPINLTEMGNQL
jgi:hypothetical protein